MFSKKSPESAALRVSSYLTFMDQTPNETLLVQGYSGAWDLVAKDIADGLRKIQKEDVKSRKNNLQQAIIPEQIFPMEIVEFFESRGYLTQLSVLEEEARLHFLEANLFKSVAGIL